MVTDSLWSLVLESMTLSTILDSGAGSWLWDGLDRWQIYLTDSGQMYKLFLGTFLYVWHKRLSCLKVGWETQHVRDVNAVQSSNHAIRLCKHWQYRGIYLYIFYKQAQSLLAILRLTRSWLELTQALWWLILQVTSTWGLEYWYRIWHASACYPQLNHATLNMR